MALLVVALVRLPGVKLRVSCALCLRDPEHSWRCRKITVSQEPSICSGISAPLAHPLASPTVRAEIITELILERAGPVIFKTFSGI